MSRVLDFKGNSQKIGIDEHDSWLRRQAIQIAAQLPESQEDAATVLSLATELVKTFLAPKPV